ncbi:MAG: hypothetical protein IJ428_06785 [Clostridia bacterium]|nr:hypothetical protein [Clostridia bacterium]
MNWSSVKNLLIAILLAANLFLLFNIVRQDRTRGYVDEEEVYGAVELLAERGLDVDVSGVPLEKFNAPVYESLYSDEYYTEAAQTLSASPRELLLSLPDGGFSISAENGTVVEFDTEFGFAYMKYGNSESAAYTKITAENFASEAALWDEIGASRLNALIKRAEDFLELCVGDDYILSAKVTDSYHDSGSGFTYLLARQLLGDYPVYSHYAVCVFDGDELVYASGRWYFAPFDEDYNTELIDQVNILFTDLTALRSYSIAPFALADISDAEAQFPTKDTATDLDDTALPSVKSMQACYAIYWNANKTALYFIPAWQIDHNDGQTVVYNATNGTVYSRN